MSIVVLAICGVFVAVGAAFAFFRVERGPSMLDRVVALDVVTAAVLATVALVSAHTKRTDLVPVLVVLALVGFIGSVTIARFAAQESDDERRILTREEARALEEQRRREEEDEAAREHPDRAGSRPTGRPADARGTRDGVRPAREVSRERTLRRRDGGT
ncbi:multicomponent Na+:H+ antiporter subunit F [Salana multivorans]|uniref:Multicomponent Na+:H+ antiporter subunit F n=1 Tax=Salana multivorans TaxID=120377 RepID=A0A3N2DAQ7_9MICO|nr:monovalent cation/H+ antiporter complex subunit F [Salana multivorans]MBN8883483.1 pH regulation protein F [Salana multivorans]OJX96981.1 MAG: hypothetical protein BGO96_02675 [Micrococcales bacterium 73-15]ROR96833.1 multicomponent Na+:H+ antiporter subunit F [Salana multivorans]